MSKIIINNLKTSCIVGINPEERSAPQEIIIDLSLKLDLSKPAKSDDIKDAVDYDRLSAEVVKFVEKTDFNLLEKLAYEVANFVKNQTKAEEVKITVRKPAAIKNADYAAVELKL